ncbi:MAG: phosphoribosyl-AMP cyclohydrolase [Eubacterium ventriosum]
MTYFSRSRNEIWVKGVTSGHFQYVKRTFYGLRFRYNACKSISGRSSMSYRS